MLRRHQIRHIPRPDPIGWPRPSAPSRPEASRPASDAVDETDTIRGILAVAELERIPGSSPVSELSRVRPWRDFETPRWTPP